MRNVGRTLLTIVPIAVLAALTAQFAPASTIEVGTCTVDGD
jgi:hypothetical protein